MVTPPPPDDDTLFGYEAVSRDEKYRRVKHVFSSVASRYDVMNDVMSLGLHRWWKRQVMAHFPNIPGSLLDVASGTGDMAFRYYQQMQCSHTQRVANQRLPSTASHHGTGPATRMPPIILTDPNPQMLALAQQRQWDHGITEGVHAVVARAEALPFARHQFEACTISFGLRNVAHLDQALREMHRVLLPGGRLLCLEFSHPRCGWWRRIYDAYSWHVIPRLGQYIAQDEASYRYLVESIRSFPSAEALRHRMQEAGFAHVTYHRYSGGVVALHVGWKL